jgi:ABC-type cobalamin transport system ATPase subunit
MRSGDIARVTNIDALVWQIGWSIIMLSRCYRNMMDNHSHEFKLYAELKGHATRGVAQEMRAPNVEKVIVRHLDYRIASSGRSFSLGARDVEVVRGANVLIDQSGAGKSTFAGLFCDSVDHDAVRVFECEIVYEDGVSEKISGADAICTFARHCCSFPQERDRQPKRKVKVREWMCVQKDDDFRANHIMREMGLTSIGLDMEIGENFAMSPGEWTRMLLARTIIADHLDTARFVVFDEPDGSIDSATTRIVIPLLMEMARNAIIVIISHNSCTQELLQDCAHLHFKCESDGAGAKKSDVTSDMV